MVDTKSASEAAKAWTDAIPRVQQRYREGVGRVQDFEGKALAGQSLYEQRMTDPNVLRRRAEGLQGAGQAWKSGAQEKGASRIGGGMQAGAPKFASRIQEVIGVINATPIGPRTADVDVNVQTRVLPLARALHAHFKS